MRTRNRVSIIVSDLETHPSLPRLLQSIARQSAGLSDVELIVAGNGAHAPSDLAIWQAITDLNDIRLMDSSPDVTVSSARNRAAEAATGDLLLFLRPDYRLDPKYLTTARSVFEDHPDTDVMYCDYISMAPPNSGSRPGMVQLPSFSPDLLQSRGILGPGATLTREAWESTEGFRDRPVYRDWDLWIQAALAGNTFYHVGYPLASCEHPKVSFRERAEDGRSKAMLVIRNQGFFHMHTVRWALSYLRGESWAEAFGFMTIPGPMDVSRMLHDQAMLTMGADILAEEAIRQFETAQDGISAI